MSTVPSQLQQGSSIVFQDKDWVHHRLSPEEDLNIPLHERPDPDTEILQQATSLVPLAYRKHSFLIDFEKRFSEVALQSLNIEEKREKFLTFKRN